MPGIFDTVSISRAHGSISMCRDQGFGDVIDHHAQIGNALGELRNERQMRRTEQQVIRDIAAGQFTQGR